MQQTIVSSVAPATDAPAPVAADSASAPRNFFAASVFTQMGCLCGARIAASLRPLPQESISCVARATLRAHRPSKKVRGLRRVCGTLNGKSSGNRAEKRGGENR